MTDGLNEQRALRVSQLMTDFHRLQMYLAALPTIEAVWPEEWHEQGYVLLRRCAEEAQAVLQANFDPIPHDGSEEQKRVELQRIILDAATRRFQAHKIYLCAKASQAWMRARNAVLQGQRAQARHLDPLQNVDRELTEELSSVTDERVHEELRLGDSQVGRWIAEDPSLSAMQFWLRSNL